MPKLYRSPLTFLLLPLLVTSPLWPLPYALAAAPAEGAAAVESITVLGNPYSWLDTPQTASEGRVEQQQLKERPLLRPGEILESVPGLVTTQHSGTGKANQYFLRGFNLDHGTDFATFVDGVPVNMPTHAHGQGYTDINFIIPEAVAAVQYAKGPYSSAYGDFSSAGHVLIETPDRFDAGLLKATVGGFGYRRLLLLDSRSLENGTDLSYGLEKTVYTGPWSDVHEDLDKTIAFAKFARESALGTWRLSLQHYAAAWNSADQIPERAVQSGQLDRMGSIDTSTGGETGRQSLALSLENKSATSSWKAHVYGLRYGLQIWSNPSYFLEDPSAGDQVEQEDRRQTFGGSLQREDRWQVGSIPVRLSYGVQQRSDFIDKVGLYKTARRVRLLTRSEHGVRESSTGLFLEQTWEWTQAFKTIFGLRHDQVSYALRDRLAEEEGRKKASIDSPKLSLIYQAHPSLNLFASGGQSFHSNDARGVVQTPSATRAAAPALVPARGYEVGFNYQAAANLRFSLALWHLLLDSELVFIGDAGTTEPARASRRQGIDALLQSYLSPALHADLELSWAEARFTSDAEHEGRHIEGALPFVGSAGIGSQLARDWNLSARFRYFGKRPLTADGSVESEPTSMLNLRASYHVGAWELAVDALNALQSRAHDIDYYYESRLANETEAVADVHFHPVEPSMLRGSLAYTF